MSDKHETTSNRRPQPRPANAFSRGFLETFHDLEDCLPLAASEAELAGPWVVREFANPQVPDELYGVFRSWEDPTSGHRPTASFKYRDLALIYAAALTVAGRGSELRLARDRDEHGQVFEHFCSGGGLEVVGHAPWYDDTAVEALGIFDALLRSVPALASLLEACGATAIELVGGNLASRLSTPLTEGSEELQP